MSLYPEAVGTCLADPIVKCIAPCGDHPVRNAASHQSAAAAERTFADKRHAFWDRDACKTPAVLKCLFSDGRHTLRDRNRTQIFAVREGSFSDFFHALRYLILVKLLKKRIKRSLAINVAVLVPDPRIPIRIHAHQVIKLESFLYNIGPDLSFGYFKVIVKIRVVAVMALFFFRRIII